MRHGSLSALSVIRRGCRSPGRGMATATATSPSAIRMGLRTRMPMAIRRAIRCGVRACRCFNGRWRDKFFFNAEYTKRGARAIAGRRVFFRFQEDAVDSCQFTVFSKRGEGLAKFAALARATEKFSAVFLPAAGEKTASRG